MKLVFSLVLAAAVLPQHIPPAVQVLRTSLGGQPYEELTIKPYEIDLHAQQDPVGDLRAALGGDAALKKIERLQVKGSFVGDQRGSGASDMFVILPDRFLEKSYGVQRRLTSPDRHSDPAAGFPDLTVEDFKTTINFGFIGNQLLVNGDFPRPAWEGRARLLADARFAYARLVIPLLGTASTVTSVYRMTNAVVFQDRDRTVWTLGLDAAGLPSKMTIERQPNKPGEWYLTGPANTVMTFSDFRPVAGGFVWPHKFVTSAGDETLEILEIKSYEINGKAPKVLLK